MLILLSPSKTLDYKTSIPAVAATQPRLLEKSEQLISDLRKLSPAKLSSLMKISDKLAELNVQRYKDFQLPFTQNNARPCIFAFKGDVYDGLDIAQFNDAALSRAQSHIRILSGLYGLLRPFDLMQPYRLEMGTKLATKAGKDLYTFWDDQITTLLNEDVKQQADDLIVNLASNEYVKAVKHKTLNGTFITPTFKEQKGNQLKVIGLFAKKARGMMTRHLMMQEKPTIDDIKRFNEGGYHFDDELSTPTELIFTRPQP